MTLHGCRARAATAGPAGERRAGRGRRRQRDDAAGSDDGRAGGAAVDAADIAGHRARPGGLATVSVGLTAKVAVTVPLLLSVTVHVSVPEHPPPTIR